MVLTIGSLVTDWSRGVPGDQRVGGIRCLLSDTGKQVGVGVHREGDRGVAEHLGHHRDVRAGRQKQ